MGKITSPRDPASGLATGRRQHLPSTGGADRTVPAPAKAPAAPAPAPAPVKARKPLSDRFEVPKSKKPATDVTSPRDPASGLPTGKRQHKPMTMAAELDRTFPPPLNKRD